MNIFSSFDYNYAVKTTTISEVFDQYELKSIIITKLWIIVVYINI